ncbi:hypothetical protein C8255_06115 [filamentous cyanobacterium CCP3]|nr:hypothetical protein C8255_06115 [filamentous cyanobacterium CCP3]
MAEETILQNGFPKGEHRDILLGPNGEVIWERPWQSNLIVDGLRSLLAGLLKGDAAVSRLNFWAVGTGEREWDEGDLPNDDDRRMRIELFNEVGRKRLDDGQITFVGGTITNQLEITTDFVVDDLAAGLENRQLREFGLFANENTTLGNGLLINHRIHPLIVMQEGFTLQRVLRLTF